jgi:hypothetical protein
VEVAALIISIVSFVLACISVWYARRSTRAAEVSARASESSAETARDQHRRQREPRLRIWLPEQASDTDDSVIYHVLNDGPDDLDSVRIHKPETPDRISHPIAAVGVDWSDAAELGKLALGEEKRFVLSIGTSAINGVEPAYRVRIASVRGSDVWEQIRELDVPRHPLGIY